MDRQPRGDCFDRQDQQLFVIYWMDMVLPLLCCVPETGVHLPWSRAQLDWACYTDCHDLSCLTWHSGALSKRRSQVGGYSGHCVHVVIGTPVVFLPPSLYFGLC